VRIPVFVLIISTLVTLVDMSLNAYRHELHKVLGLFLPLIVVNCSVLGRVEAFASRQPLVPSIVDGLTMGLGFTATLTLLGGIRELLGSGTLFANASQLLGTSLAFLEARAIPEYPGFLLAILPPGGFLVVGFLLAGKRILDASRSKKKVWSGGSPLSQTA
jgi:electron transport complex protein RnfE